MNQTRVRPCGCGRRRAAGRIRRCHCRCWTMTKAHPQTGRPARSRRADQCARHAAWPGENSRGAAMTTTARRPLRRGAARRHGVAPLAGRATAGWPADRRADGDVLGWPAPGSYSGPPRRWLARHPAWPVTALLAGYPLWWALGVADFMFFFFNDTATTEIYTLSLHDALPI